MRDIELHKIHYEGVKRNTFESKLQTPPKPLTPQGLEGLIAQINLYNRRHPKAQVLERYNRRYKKL